MGSVNFVMILMTMMVIMIITRKRGTENKGGKRSSSIIKRSTNSDCAITKYQTLNQVNYIIDYLM